MRVQRQMDNLKIMLFMCNWGPHAAFQALQDNGSPIPLEFRMVRIPCTGRMSKSLLFRAFEMGADGVALLGCVPGSCRYGSGTPIASRNVEETRTILQLLGLGENRLRLETFHPEQSDALLGFLQGFLEEIRTLGKSPVQPGARDEEAFSGGDGGTPGLSYAPPSPEGMGGLSDLLASHDIYACQDCGKCSSSCPLSLTGKPFSPRTVANAVLSGTLEAEPLVRDTWACLTCGICYDRCPSAVTFPEFIRDMRQLQHRLGIRGHEAHDGFFQSLMRTMTSPNLQIDHWSWLPPDIRIDRNSRTLFFGGCSPYFDAFFQRHLGIHTSQILVDSLRLLNFFDIAPNILTGERCCGHDLLWSGDRQGFTDLAALNMKAFEECGVEEIVTACPECYRTLSHDYPALGFPASFRVTHLYDLLEREIDKGAVGFESIHRRLTFQDSCRLSRAAESSELPRKLLGRLRPLSFQEMQAHGKGAICCGNCAWTGCDSYSKALQVKRLRQAKETGADLLVTACPKCQIHLRCAMEDPFVGKELQIEMMDLTSILAKTIHWEG